MFLCCYGLDWKLISQGQSERGQREQVQSQAKPDYQWDLAQG